MPPERTNPETPLKRTMGLFPAAAMVAGIILGASIIAIRGLPISEADCTKILGSNAAGLLKLQ